MLFGINEAKLHTGEIREAGGPVARHSPLGWVVFIATAGQRAEANKVNHIKFTTPVDMTDLWTTEPMGVSINLCY